MGKNSAAPPPTAEAEGQCPRTPGDSLRTVHQPQLCRARLLPQDGAPRVGMPARPRAPGGDGGPRAGPSDPRLTLTRQRPPLGDPLWPFWWPLEWLGGYTRRRAAPQRARTESRGSFAEHKGYPELSVPPETPKPPRFKPGVMLLRCDFGGAPRSPGRSVHSGTVPQKCHQMGQPVRSQRCSGVLRWSHGGNGQPWRTQGQGWRGGDAGLCRTGKVAGPPSSTGAACPPLSTPFLEAISGFRKHRNISGGFWLTGEERKETLQRLVVHTASPWRCQQGGEGCPGTAVRLPQAARSPRQKSALLQRALAFRQRDGQILPSAEAAAWASHLPASTSKSGAGRLEHGGGGPTTARSHLP